MIRIEKPTRPDNVESFFARAMPEWIFRKALHIEGKETGEDIVETGNFLEWFGKAYLPGYIENLRKYAPESVASAQEIKPILDKFMPVILSFPEIKYRPKKLISGVAQSMIYYFITKQLYGEGRLPPRYWDFRPAFAQKAADYRERGQETAARFLESLVSDPDIDMKWGMNGTKMATIVQKFHAKLVASQRWRGKVSDIDLSAQTADVKIGQTYEGVAFEIEYSQHTRIRVGGGPLPHNTSIDGFYMWIFDRSGETVDAVTGKVTQYGRRVFHVEPRNIPETHEGLALDLRGGMTYTSQDYSDIDIGTDEGQILYAITRRNVESLLFQDQLELPTVQLPTGRRTLSELSESPVRMSRMRLMFDVGFCWVRDEHGNFRGVLPLPQINLIFPQLYNLFDLRKWIRELSIEGKGIRPERLVLFQQELAVGLWKRLYEEKQFVYYGGFQYLSERLRNAFATTENILTSPPMVITGMNGIAGFRPDQLRQVQFLTEQIEAYGEGSQIDGLERFMRTLGASPGDEITEFLKLFMLEDRPDKTYIRENSPRNKQLMEEAVKGTFFTKLTQGEQRRYIKELCLLYEIVREFPQLTPRELQETYIKVSGVDIGSYKYEDLLFYLISTGLLVRIKEQRLHNSGDFVDVEFLSIRSPIIHTEWNRLAGNNRFRTFWDGHGLSKDLSTTLDEICGFISSFHIPSVEALESFGDEDRSTLEVNVKREAMLGMNDESFSAFWHDAEIALLIAQDFLKSK